MKLLELALPAKKALDVEAELVEVLTQSAEGIEPPCPYFTRCGGCDFLQHINIGYQRKLKSTIIAESLKVQGLGLLLLLN